MAASMLLGWEHYALYLIPVLVLPVLLTVVYQKRAQKNYPPFKSGLLPYVGCAIEFGKAPLHFIEEAAKQLGPVFTLKVAGKRLTFVTQVEDFKHFFSSPNVDFQKAVQKPVKYAASVSPESFFQYHTKIHDTVKGRLASTNLEPFCVKLGVKFAEQLELWGKEGEGDLNEMVRSAMYIAVLDNLFGENVLPTKQKEAYTVLEEHFVKYDDQFEYGSQLPEFFVRDWGRSKHWLLGRFGEIVSKLDKQKKKATEADETVFETLVGMVDRPHAPNYGLLMMWASLANAIPITFWTLAFILSHPEIAKEVKAEIEKAIGTNDKELRDLHFSQEDFQSMPSVKRCILESIRLRSPGVITRGVSTDFTIKGYTVPSGDLLMMSPYWAHRNPQLFPDPEAFKPDRWKSADLEKNIFLEGFVAFGGGRYQCPGRWFALLEIQLIVAMIMYKFDIELLDPVPINSPLHLVGTQQPEGGLRIHYTM